MAALGAAAMAVPPSMSVPWAGSAVTMMALNVLPISTAANGKSAAANVLTVPPLMTNELPVEVGGWFTCVTLNVSKA